MRLPTFELLLSAYLIVATNAGSAIPVRLRPSVAESDRAPGSQQHPLAPPKAPASSRTESEHYDAAQNSVGVLFTTTETDVEVVHFWLPLGRKIFTREC